LYAADPHAFWLIGADANGKPSFKLRPIEEIVVAAAVERMPLSDQFRQLYGEEPPAWLLKGIKQMKQRQIELNTGESVLDRYSALLVYSLPWPPPQDPASRETPVDLLGHWLSFLIARRGWQAVRSPNELEQALTERLRRSLKVPLFNANSGPLLPTPSEPEQGKRRLGRVKTIRSD